MPRKIKPAQKVSRFFPLQRKKGALSAVYLSFCRGHFPDMRKIRKTIVLESWTTVLVNLTECPKNFFEERGNSVHSDRFPAKSGRIGEQFEGIQAEQQYARRGIPPGVPYSFIVSAFSEIIWAAQQTACSSGKRLPAPAVQRLRPPESP